MTEFNSDWIVPQWPCPPSVRALITTRAGGVSTGPYASMNLGDAVGDNMASVMENRRRLNEVLPTAPKWLRQVHGSHVISAETIEGMVEADASFTTTAGTVCVIGIADCLPVLLCDRDARVVAAAHAGWRGLCAGVLENTVRSMQDAADNVDAGEILAYLGPAIGPSVFEVGEEVRTAFVERDPHAAKGFRRHRREKWLADLFVLARQRLNRAGVSAIYGGGVCTYTDPERFFSYRRDRISGRMAALIWLARA
jgi:YfiH family protein